MKNKALIIGLMTLAVASAVAATSFDRANTLKEGLKLHHVDGKKEEAAQLAIKLAQIPNNEPFIQGALQEELRSLDNPTLSSNLDKDLKFVTGSKTEIYCEGKGLVEMSGEHGDGSTSHLVLLRSNRKLLSGSYSQIESGDWTYELTNSYRRPSVSEFWMLGGTTSSYHIKEVRNKQNGKADSGDFSANWSGTKSSNNFTAKGEGAEPMHSYMALDFQIWGNPDLGYRTKFEPDSQFTSEQTYTTSTKLVTIKSERTTGAPIAESSIKDSQGVSHLYRNCFPVKYQISLKSIKNRELEVEGKIKVDRVKKVIRTNRYQALSCMAKARIVDPTLHGDVTVAWDINDSGEATNVRPGGRNLMGNGGGFNIRDELVQCLVDSVKSWRFPMAAEGTTAHVSYPFTFKIIK